MTTAARRTGFVPWPYPAGAGLAIGVYLAWSLNGFGKVSPAGETLGLAPGAGGVQVVLGAGVLILACAAAAAARLPGHVIPVLLAFAVLGAGRYQMHAESARRQAERLEPLLGTGVRWEGRYDGATFTAAMPVRVRLALVSHVEVPAGRLVVEATAERAPGKRNPGGFDYAAYLARRGVAGQLFIDEVLTAEPVTSVRERLRRGVTAGLPPDLAGLMVAMTLGLRDDLGVLRNAFTASGLAHLLSLSGLHFGVLLAAAARPLARFGVARVYLLMGLTVAFVALVGTAPSVLRAASMAMAALIGLASGVGRFESWTVLLLAFTIGLLAAPQMLLDISFQLSYLALAGLLLFTTPLSRRLVGAWSNRTAPAHGPGRAVRWLRATVVGGLIVSVAAQLPSLSLVAASFGTIPLMGPLVNVVAVPLAAVAVPLGFAAGLLGLVAEPLAWLVNRATLVFARPLTWLADVGAAGPALTWGEVTWLGHACWVAFVAAAALVVRGRLRLHRGLIVALCAGSVTAAAGPVYSRPDVWFLDVGQGDAILVRLPGGYEVLIDGGGSPFSDDDVGRRVVLPALRALGVTSLELMVATHPDADHVEGLFSVLDEMRVETLVTGPARLDNDLDRRLRHAAVLNGTAVHVARRGETLVLGDTGTASTLEVLNPPADPGALTSNEASVVLLLRYRGQAVALFTGDSGAPTEEELFVPHVHLIQAGHHGSRFSTSDHLLAATSPRYAVVSVGDNNYGHPHPDVLARLQAHGVRTYLTRTAGAVRLSLRGDGNVSSVTADGEGP